MYVGLGIVKIDDFQPQWLSTDEIVIIESQLGLVCIQTEQNISMQSIRQYSVSLSRIIRNGTIIPLRFGTIFEEEADIQRALREGADVYTSLLNKFNNQFEVELWISWSKDNFSQDMLNDKKLARWKKLLESGKGQGYDVVEFGKAVQEAADRKRQNIRKKVLEILRPLARAYQINECHDELEAFHGIFLLLRSQEEEFDQAVDVLYKKLAEGYTFKYTGPWPVHHFLNQ